MGKQKLSRGSLKILLLSALLLLLFYLSAAQEAHASSASARRVTAGGKAVIERLNLSQIGASEIMMTLFGTDLPLPEAVSADNSARLVWKNTRFPQDTDRKQWWDGFEGDVLKINLKNSESWTRTYDLPLIERITVSPDDKGGIVMDIKGPRRLNIRSISGLPGSERLRIMLEAPCDITPQPVIMPGPAVQKTGPLAVSDPLTLELRNVSAREVFCMLAKIRDLNIILDASVPDTPMTFSFRNARFGDVFEYMLRMNDLSYSIAGSTLVIGTVDSVGKTLGLNITRQYKVAYADPAKLPAIIMGVIPLARPPVVDERLRSIYVTGTPEQHRRVETLMNRVDHPGRQVMIEARLIEITDSASQEIESIISAVYRGWLFTYGATGLSSRYTYMNGLTGTKLNADSGASTAAAASGVNIADPAMKMLDAGLRTLESDNKGKILASPSVVALDGQKATVKLVHDYLYQSGVDDKGNPKFSKEETGPTLEFTPSLGRDGFITIKMKISTGDIVAFRRSGNSEAPETTRREVDTQVRVRSGEIFVVGGLYQENKTSSIARVPVLGYIPLLGEFFKTRSASHTKSQLAFIAIPYILDIPASEAEVLELADTSLCQQEAACGNE